MHMHVSWRNKLRGESWFAVHASCNLPKIKQLLSQTDCLSPWFSPLIKTVFWRVALIHRIRSFRCETGRPNGGHSPSSSVKINFRLPSSQIKTAPNVHNGTWTRGKPVLGHYAMHMHSEMLWWNNHAHQGGRITGAKEQLNEPSSGFDGSFVS